MKHNVGALDLLIRFAIAAAALAIFLTGQRPAWEYALLAVGAVLAFTALTGSCPLYRAIGMRTDRRDAPK